MTLYKLEKRSFNDVAFAEFDRNLNFISDNILLRLKHQENYSHCRMDFVRDGIVDSLMEQ
jgi:hypothetical protein